MYIVSLTLKTTPEATNLHQQGHKEWIETYTKHGTFLFAGPRPDRLGGIVVVESVPRDELDSIIAADPFVVADLVSVEVQEFNAAFKAK